MAAAAAPTRETTPPANLPPTRGHNGRFSVNDSRYARSWGPAGADPDGPLGDWYQDWELEQDLRQARRLVALHRQAKLHLDDPTGPLRVGSVPGASGLAVPASRAPRVASPPPTAPIVSGASHDTNTGSVANGSSPLQAALPFACALVGLLGGGVAVIAWQTLAPLWFPIVLFAEGVAGLALAAALRPLTRWA